MYQENVVLCGASAYEQKYYFNQDFAFSSGIDQTGTAYHVCPLYRGCRRNPDTGV